MPSKDDNFGLLIFLIDLFKSKSSLKVSLEDQQSEEVLVLFSKVECSIKINVLFSKVVLLIPNETE